MTKQLIIQSGLLYATIFFTSLLSISSKKIKLEPKRNSVDLKGLDFRTYPRRSEDEAAVIEWGNSAIISAIDASVAYFGPQTSQAALLEVETMPILGFPVNGVRDATKPPSKSDLESDNEMFDSEKLQKLENSADVFGNAVVMTNTGGLSGVDMALLAQNSGAAALVVVNVDEERPDDIHRLGANLDEDGRAQSIDIPIVMISLNSANVLTTATVTAEMQHEDIINHGMPERIRLYAGGDRPFFEDVEAAEPTIYIIHNLLTKKECNSLVEQAKPLVGPVTGNDSLQITQDYTKFKHVQRVMIWDGFLKSPDRKSIDERIEQVTGFPSLHYSDFIIDKLGSGSYWDPHYDTIDGSIVPIATITIFLTDTHKGGEIIYPAASGKPVKIQPRKGLAVVHHNSDENNQFEIKSLHAILPVEEGEEVYVARKFILPAPVSKTRRFVLPILSYPFGGKLPDLVVLLYKFMIQLFGQESGEKYFDNFFIFLPAVILLALAYFILNLIRKRIFQEQSAPLVAMTTPTQSSIATQTSPKKQVNGKKKD